MQLWHKFMCAIFFSSNEYFLTVIFTHAWVTCQGIKDFCGWLRWASLLFFFTTVFHLHPSEGICAFDDCLQPPSPPTWNEPAALFRNKPTFFPLYHPEPTALWSAEEGREGGNLQNLIWPSRESNLCQFGINCSTDWATGHGTLCIRIYPYPPW